MALNYAKLFNRRITPQSRPIPVSTQVANSGGGYSRTGSDRRNARFKCLILRLAFADGPLMPRRLRIEYPGAIYHVVSRGDQRGDILAQRLHLGEPKAARTNLHKFLNGFAVELSQAQMDL